MKLRDARRNVQYLPETAGSWHSWLQQTYGKPTEECVLPTFQSYSESGLGSNAVVFGLMLARGMLFSEASFKWRDKTTKKLFGSPDLKILERPWPNGSTGELLVRMMQDVDLAGNSYIRRDPDGRLVRLRPDWTSIVLVGVGEEEERTRWDVVGYTHYLNGPGGDMEFYPVDEVAHWSPIPDPLATYRGMSWLTPVVREINADLAMTDYKRNYLDNAATPNLFIKYQRQLTPGALKRVREVFQAQHGGVDGLKTAILDGGADVTVVGDSLAGMDFTNVQGAGENRIAVAAGVPGIVAGLKEGLEAATYSNYVQAMRRFVDLTIRPLWRSACAALAAIVTVPGGAELWFDTTDIAALRQGDKERADTALVLATAAQALITAGYEATSVVAFLSSGDVTQLKHTGLMSVQLLPAGQAEPEPDTSDPAEGDEPTEPTADPMKKGASSG